jgi:hypothetical protein
MTGLSRNLDRLGSRCPRDSRTTGVLIGPIDHLNVCAAGVSAERVPIVPRGGVAAPFRACLSENRRPSAVAHSALTTSSRSPAAPLDRALTLGRRYAVICAAT